MATREQRLQAVHERAMQQFRDIEESIYQERMLCLEDRRFYSVAGAQWEGSLQDQFANKPMLEVNKIHLSVIRIFNEYRNNRISVSFTSKEGSEYNGLAEVCNGLHRSDEDDSCAEEAYDNAFEESVGGGFGAWRLRTEYENEEDEDDEKQRIRIEPIFDADSSVFFDLNSKRQDKSDAKYCFVLTAMSVEAFEEEYEEDLSTIDKTIQQGEFDWFSKDSVFVAEYYVVEMKKEKVHFFKSLTGEELKVHEDDLTEEYFDELKTTGHREVRQKTTKVRRIHKYILSGNRVLEDCGIIAGKHIPIVPTFGKRWFVDNVERCMGHVRLCKDVQRLKNMQISKLAEIAGQTSTEKPIFTPEQMAGHAQMWADDNLKNYPYLLINPIIDANGQKMPAGPIAYTKPPVISPAMAALLQTTEQDMQDILGNQQVGEELQPNMSGKAVELVQNKLDMQTFIYLSNLRKAIKRSGQIWLSIAKDIFVEENRKLKTVDLQGKVDSVEIMKPGVDPDTAERKYENDLTDADFDVKVEVGPSSSSKRAATVRALTGMMMITTDPEAKQVLGAMALMNMEGEGINEVNDYYRRKLIKMGIIKPTDEEAVELNKELQNQKPDAQTEYLQAAAEQATAEGAKARADTVLTIAKSEETRAKTIKTLAEVEAMPGEQQAKMAAVQPTIG